MIRLIGYSARPAVDPTALPGIGMSVMVAPLLSTLVVEELHLDRVLVRTVADARRDVRVGTFDVEVVPVRIPGQTGLPAVVVVRVVRREFEVLMLVANPGHDLGGCQIVPDLRGVVILLRQRRGEEARAAVEAEHGELAVERVLRRVRQGDEAVDRPGLVFILAIRAHADGEHFLVSQVDARVGVAGLGVPEVVLQAPRGAERVARAVAAEALEDARAILEPVVHEVALCQEAGVAADRRLRRGALAEGVGAVVERQQRRGALQAVAAERRQHQAGVDDERVVRGAEGFPPQEDVLGDEARAEGLWRLAEVRIVGLEEERDRGRNLTPDQEAEAAEEEVVRVSLRIGGDLRGVRPRLDQRSEFDVDVVVDLDGGLPIGEGGDEKANQDSEERQDPSGPFNHDNSLSLIDLWHAKREDATRAAWRQLGAGGWRQDERGGLTGRRCNVGRTEALAIRVPETAQTERRMELLVER